jgi:hypothetical protein
MSLLSIPVFTDPNLPRYATRWEFPPDRFVEYEESDEVWAKQLGFGRSVTTDQPAIFIVFGRIYIHPDSLRDLRSCGIPVGSRTSTATC